MLAGTHESRISSKDQHEDDETHQVCPLKWDHTHVDQTHSRVGERGDRLEQSKPGGFDESGLSLEYVVVPALSGNVGGYDDKPSQLEEDDMSGWSREM